MNINTLKNILLNCWDKETAAQNEWDEGNPPLNQCAVTALIVQDYFGGDLLRCETIGKEKGSHYWNKLPDGEEVDLTKEQFNHISDKPLLEDWVIRTREYVLGFEETKKRYLILKSRVEEAVTKLTSQDD